MDAAIRYKFKKSNSIIELAAVNLTNQLFYTTIYVSGNSLSQNSYTLRPRMLIARLSVSL